jgi:hypothetical protein
MENLRCNVLAAFQDNAEEKTEGKCFSIDEWRHNEKNEADQKKYTFIKKLSDNED